jgi:hypothetical protein
MSSLLSLYLAFVSQPVISARLALHELPDPLQRGPRSARSTPRAHCSWARVRCHDWDVVVRNRDCEWVRLAVVGPGQKRYARIRTFAVRWP